MLFLLLCIVVPFIVQGQACVNNERNCEYWSRVGSCKKGQSHYRYMSLHCRKSCGFCRTTTLKPAPPRKTPAPRTTRLTTTRLITAPRITVSCGVDKRRKIGAFIINGKTAMPNVWPWQIGYYYKKVFKCGGTLITDRIIVIAAHCVENKNELKMKIRLGDHKRNIDEGTEQEYDVEDYLIHDDYESTFSYDNDIALILLASPVQLNVNVNTACLPDEDVEVDVNSECYVSGWGKMVGNGTSVNILQEAKLPIVPSDVCGKRNKDSFGNSKISGNMICAGETVGTTSGCQGDSGGPFVCKANNGKWVLQGVVSWGSRHCENEVLYTVFTRVSKYVKWIKDNIDI